jgi:hypothetical protein
MPQIIPQETIEQKIYLIRGQRVMLSHDLAELYGVKTKALLQAVRRNMERFPDDFVYQLTKDEVTNLRSQFVTSRWGGHRYVPYAFTEQGVAMLSSVLRSKRAILVNIAIMRTFARLRRLISNHKELASKLKELELKVQIHDKDIILIFRALNKLMVPPEEKPKHRIGFHAE